MISSLAVKYRTETPPLLSLILNMAESLNVRRALMILEDTYIDSHYKVDGGKCSNLDVVLYIHSLLDNLMSYKPFSIFNSYFLTYPPISNVFASSFTTKSQGTLVVYEKFFKIPNYSEHIRKFIRNHFDERGKSTCELTSEKIWDLIEFVFKKNDIQMIKESIVKDQSGELTFQNVNCVMYSNLFNICCFEIPEFSANTLNEWDNAFLIPIVMLLNNISKNLYHNTCLSIIKHGNKISIFAGIICGFIQIAPHYCIDSNDSNDFGLLIGAIIQYSSCFKKAEAFDFIKDKGKFIDKLNPWLVNYGRLQKEVRKCLREEKKKDEHFRKSFQSLKL